VADTETMMSYEAGIKGTGYDNRIRFDADVFAYRVNDLQLTAVGGGSQFQPTDQCRARQRLWL